jgi:hypothetical protein
MSHCNRVGSASPMLPPMCPRINLGRCNRCDKCGLSASGRFDHCSEDHFAIGPRSVQLVSFGALPTGPGRLHHPLDRGANRAAGCPRPACVDLYFLFARDRSRGILLDLSSANWWRGDAPTPRLTRCLLVWGARLLRRYSKRTPRFSPFSKRTLALVGECAL